eukprot:5918737-Amphidinium_carterae.1
MPNNEEINRYESEKETIANHVNIASIINHLKGSINHHLMLKGTNTATSQGVQMDQQLLQ